MQMRLPDCLLMVRSVSANLESGVAMGKWPHALAEISSHPALRLAVENSSLFERQPQHARVDVVVALHDF